MDVSLGLQKYFGYNSFRQNQAEIIQADIDDNDIIAILPTGSGKSLTFQLPALLQPGLTIVFSPLIALMQDQLYNLHNKGIDCVGTINASQSYCERNKAFTALSDKSMKLLYVAPERLLDEKFLKLISQQVIRRIIVDEAHCLAQWGEDFRPDYFKIREFAEKQKKPPISAYTATASAETIEAISQSLSLNNPLKVIGSIRRPELHIQVIEAKNYNAKINSLLNIIKDKSNQSGIVYVARRASGEHLANQLRANGIKAFYYHSDMNSNTRKKVAQAFQTNKLSVIVATRAFGLGIDKPDIRFIIHFDTPLTMETYIQEIGRAGRDGQPAECILLYAQNDVMLQVRLSNSRMLNKKLVSEILSILKELNCNDFQPINFEKLQKRLGLSKVAIRILLNKLQEQNFLKISGDLPLEIEIIEGKLPYDLGQDFEIIDLSNYPNPSQTFNRLMDLEKTGDIKMLIKSTAPSIRLNQTLPHIPDALFAEYNLQLITKMRSQMHVMMNYATAQSCRFQLLEDSLGESNQEICGVCDNCNPNEIQNVPFENWNDSITYFSLKNQKLTGLSMPPMVEGNRGIIQHSSWGNLIAEALNGKKSAIDSMVNQICLAIEKSRQFKHINWIASISMDNSDSNIKELLINITKRLNKKYHWKIIETINLEAIEDIVIIIFNPEQVLISNILTRKEMIARNIRFISLTREGVL
jgi:RecQ family ATP-dependent DNA helicase